MAETRVLIVDDDREITRAIGLRLSNVGFKPIMAYNGQEGLEVVQKNPPDAIILDLRMPVMDGFQLLEKLQNSVHTRSIPAIILSADAADKARLKALAGGRHVLRREALQGSRSDRGVKRHTRTPAG